MIIMWSFIAVVFLNYRGKTQCKKVRMKLLKGTFGRLFALWHLSRQYLHSVFTQIGRYTWEGLHSRSSCVPLLLPSDEVVDWCLTSFDSFQMAFVWTGQTQCTNFERQACEVKLLLSRNSQLCISEFSHFDQVSSSKNPIVH